MLVQPGLCRTCSETTLLVFPRGGSYFNLTVVLLKNREVREWNDSMYLFVDGLNSLNKVNNGLKLVDDVFSSPS